MTRSSPLWPLLGFLVAFVGVGFRYWPVDYAALSLPGSLYGPGLVVVGLVALLLRAFDAARFLIAWLLAAAAVPAAVMVKVVIDTQADPTRHNLWPFELVIAVVLGLGFALAGALIGHLLARGYGRQPA